MKGHLQKLSGSMCPHVSPMSGRCQRRREILNTAHRTFVFCEQVLDV